MGATESRGIDPSWQVVVSQRLAIADLLAALSEADWEQPSLCAGWRVRDVAAHVTGDAARALASQRTQRLSVKAKSPERLPPKRTADMRFSSATNLSTSARDSPRPSAISRTGRTGIRAAKRTTTSIATFPGSSGPPVSRRQASSQSSAMRLRRRTTGS
jgi:uncharacterized protein (TIGR03083 family)